MSKVSLAEQSGSIIRFKAQLDRIEKMLKTLLAEKKKQVWIKAVDVIELTGWNKEKMRRMRDYGVIVHKHDNGHWYDLNSIPEQFLKANPSADSSAVRSSSHT